MTDVAAAIGGSRRGAFRRLLYGWWPCLLLTGLALALRLLVWRWHAQYPLGGDEQEYLNQALILLRERRYEELRLMRPPLYTGFLALSIQLFDSLVQRLRLIQAIISALTVVPAYGLAHTLIGRRAALIAGVFVAFNYTLAAAATELLTETLFLFGLTIALWLLAEVGRRPDRLAFAIAAGLTIGALALLRSVALPLIPLAALWLFLTTRRLHHSSSVISRSVIIPAISLVCSAVLVIAPWTIRNYRAYQGLILIDTTGAENLWLDNDPAGREEVKRQLYALGDDRLLRQQLATQRGLAAIVSDPARFLAKAAGEAQRFFALQHFDDLRDRPAIWVPPTEVWLRLLLGDGLWLVILLGGVAGLWLAPRGAPEMRWLMALWTLYTLVTALIFHVELRYRLPLYPALLPYAAWFGERVWVGLSSRRKAQGVRARLLRFVPRAPHLRLLAAGLTVTLILIATLLHRPYPIEALSLARKHIELSRADRALDRGDSTSAQAAAEAALALDDRSVLARVALARAHLLNGDRATALALLVDAERAIAGHPHPHLLRGALLLADGDPEGALPELAFETSSLQDLQNWSWDRFRPILAPPGWLDIGGGLDLGHIRGFFPAEASGARWTTGKAQIRLAAPGGPATLVLRVAAARPLGAPAPQLAIHSNGGTIAEYTLGQGWQVITLPVPTPVSGDLIITINSDTFRPRDYDRTSSDGRTLGILVDWVEVQP